MQQKTLWASLKNFFKHVRALDPAVHHAQTDIHAGREKFYIIGQFFLKMIYSMGEKT